MLLDIHHPSRLRVELYPLVKKVIARKEQLELQRRAKGEHLPDSSSRRFKVISHRTMRDKQHQEQE